MEGVQPFFLSKEKEKTVKEKCPWSEYFGKNEEKTDRGSGRNHPPKPRKLMGIWGKKKRTDNRRKNKWKKRVVLDNVRKVVDQKVLELQKKSKIKRIGINSRRSAGISKNECEIAMETRISGSSVQRIIQKDFGFKTFKRMKVTVLSTNVK